MNPERATSSGDSGYKSNLSTLYFYLMIRVNGVIIRLKCVERYD